MQFHPPLLRGVVVPPSFSLDHRPITVQLDSIDLLLTVSSTAALEAAGAGVGVAFVADLGVREQLGNHILLGSGLLRTFDQIEADDLGVPEGSGWRTTSTPMTVSPRPWPSRHGWRRRPRRCSRWARIAGRSGGWGTTPPRALKRSPDRPCSPYRTGAYSAKFASQPILDSSAWAEPGRGSREGWFAEWLGARQGDSAHDG